MKRASLRSWFFYVLLSLAVHVCGVLWIYFIGHQPDKVLEQPISIRVQYSKGDLSPGLATVKTNMLKRPVSHKPLKKALPNPRELEKGYQERNLVSSLEVKGADLGMQVHYPRLSRILREKGRVLIELHKDSDGQVSFVIAHSSGFLRLDTAALNASEEALKAGLLQPYFAKHGTMQISFIFKLTDAH